MRNVKKLPPPRVLVENKDLWDSAVRTDPSDHNKNQYRHTDIKETLLQETKSKCVYCESKIRHNCPGDIEHKIPKSKRPDLMFEWDNMTIACSECNRRKSEYHEPDCMFLDPNKDDVESMIFHAGPFVFSMPATPRSETTVRLLELDRMDRRPELIARKLERLEQVRNLAERISREVILPLKQILLESLQEQCSSIFEYSGMTKAFLSGLLP